MKRWADHCKLEMSDARAFADATSLTFWNVKVPADFFAALPILEFLDIRGGSARNLETLAGLTRLRGLVLNQIRGLSSLDELAGLVGLEILSLYGLPHVEALPSLRRLTALRRLELGQMRSLGDLRGAAEAPALEELSGTSQRLAVLGGPRMDASTTDRLAACATGAKHSRPGA